MNDCSRVCKKRVGLSILASFIFIHLFDWLFHGTCLKEIYAATPNLWRPMDEMMGHMKWLMLGQFLMAFFLVSLFVKGYEAKGIREGVRFGFWMGLVLGVPQHLIVYAVAPYSEKLIAYWMIGTLIEVIGVGVILSLVYKNKA